MAVVVGTFYNYYKYLFSEFQDPTIEKFPLLGSPFPVLIIVALYTYSVLSWGPKFMANRKPFDLPRTMMIYNAFQVIINAYIVVEGCKVTVLEPEFSVLCEPISHADTPARRRRAFLSYIYFLTKISDFLDTWFYVLRKKNNQISFLHVYHHGGMMIFSYVFTKFVVGSHGSLLGVVNSFVHACMYSYYFVTLFKPEMKSSLWWKKYITQLQMIQFAAMIVHFSMPLFVKSCTTPTAIIFFGITQNLFMFALFSDFYYKAYLKKKHPPKPVKVQ